MHMYIYIYIHIYIHTYIHTHCTYIRIVHTRAPRGLHAVAGAAEVDGRQDVPG